MNAVLPGIDPHVLPAEQQEPGPEQIEQLRRGDENAERGSRRGALQREADREVSDEHGAVSSQIRHRCTITSTAFSMSCADTHSSREWKLCSPAKRFGVGRPMNDSREPSVPPRIDRERTSSPARLTASQALAVTAGWPIEHFLHVPVLLFDGDLDARARMRGHGGSGDGFEQPLLVLQARRVEVANDELDRGALDSCRQRVRMDEALVAVGRLGRQRHRPAAGR